MRSVGIFISLLALLVFSAPARAGTPKVVVSLKPIHALASAVMEGVAEPTLIVTGAASEHLYVMKPSEAAALEDADVIVWVGPVMESYLVRPIAALPRHARILTLMEEPRLTRLTKRRGGLFEADADDAPLPPGKAVYDGHLWLDPENAQIIADLMAQTLGSIDPGHAAQYRANAARLKNDLGALDAELKMRLQPLRTKPFIVFHDAYHYLEARYGLTVAGSVTAEPGLPVSARRVKEIRTKILSAGARCVFAEPQFEPRLVRVIVEGTAARSGSLDPLGAALMPGRAAYFALMRNLASALDACLTG